MAQPKYNREVAFRAFAKEIHDTTLVLERDAEDTYAPQYIVTPTGAKINRVFVVGTLTSIEDVGSETEYWRARLADPTGTHVAYAGEYQPEAARALSEVEIPAILGVVAKIAVYYPDDDKSGNPTLSLRPETVTELDETARARWVVATARQTLARIYDLEEYHPESADDMMPYRQMVWDALSEVLD